MHAIGFKIERKIVTQKYESMTLGAEFSLTEDDNLIENVGKMDRELKEYINSNRT